MSTTQQPEALNLEEFRAKVTHAAREPLLARIAELEAQLSAIGAGGVEPLRKREADETVEVPPGWKITEGMHVAAVKVLHRASGVDGLPQRMVDAMLAAAPQAKKGNTQQ